MLIVISIVALLVLGGPWGYVAVAAAVTLEFAELLFWRRFLRRYRIRTGIEALIGSPAQVVEACDPQGRVRLRGELWNATSTVPLGEGDEATVTGIEGLTLLVEPGARTR